MGPVEALKLALGEENKAIALYEQFNREHPQLNDIFLFLINEEHKHRNLLEKKISELTKY
ncbi:MAG: ferritin family protein [Candidatus Omnitrophica bacterium]|nr:ferritin family protein [Candidatus Omnitrophota bacterium]